MCQQTGVSMRTISICLKSWYRMSSISFKLIHLFNSGDFNCTIPDKITTFFFHRLRIIAEHNPTFRIQSSTPFCYRSCVQLNSTCLLMKVRGEQEKKQDISHSRHHKLSGIPGATLMLTAGELLNLCPVFVFPHFAWSSLRSALHS